MDGFSFTLGDPSIHQDDGPQNGRTTGGIAGLFRADEEEVNVGNASFRYGVRTEASAPAGDVAEGDGAKATRAAADTDAGGVVKAARAPVVVAATTLSQLYKVESGTHRPLGLAGLAAMASAGGFSLLCYNQSKQPYFQQSLHRTRPSFTVNGLFVTFWDSSGDDSNSCCWSMLFRDAAELVKLARVIVAAMVLGDQPVDQQQDDAGDASAEMTVSKAAAGTSGGDAPEPTVDAGDTVLCSYSVHRYDPATAKLIEVERHDKVKFDAGRPDTAPTSVPEIIVSRAVGMERGATKCVASRDTMSVQRTGDNGDGMTIFELTVQKIKKKNAASSGADPIAAEKSSSAGAQSPSRDTSRPIDGNCAWGNAGDVDIERRTPSPARGGSLKERMARLGQRIPFSPPPAAPPGTSETTDTEGPPVMDEVADEAVHSSARGAGDSGIVVHHHSRDASKSEGGARALPPPWWYNLPAGSLHEDYMFKSAMMEAMRGLEKGQAQILSTLRDTPRVDDAKTPTSPAEDESRTFELQRELEKVKGESARLIRERDERVREMEEQLQEASDVRLADSERAARAEAALREETLEKEALMSTVDQLQSELDRAATAGNVGQSRIADARQSAKALMVLVFEELRAPDDAGNAISDGVFVRIKEIFRRCFKRDDWVSLVEEAHP